MIKSNKAVADSSTQPLATKKENYFPVKIQEQMQSAYLDYAMSVIVGRALPDIRDGLKPVHRRILYAMNERAWRSDRPFVKCAKIVGEVIGNYHPHGDAAIYGALVRLVQTFSMNLPLIEGQGNFGSIDGDSPAAYRYTEARLKPITTKYLLTDIHMNTVDFVTNFDDTRKEPSLFPAAFPNLYINGSEGIAVGMTTSIPPHNFNEVIQATIALIKNPNLTIRELHKYVLAPDFPTGGIIVGANKLLQIYEKGEGSFSLRAKIEVHPNKKKKRDIIVIRNIPYQVNKTKLLEKIGDLVKEKKIIGIADIRDLSDRHGVNVEIELKREAITQVVLNQLYKQTPLQRSISVSFLALIDNQPRIFNLKEGLLQFITHRQQVIVRRTKFLLDEASKRAHILEGFKKALDNLDAVIQVIRKSVTVADAKKNLIKEFDFSDQQATAILELRLQKLTALEQKKIIEELKLLKQKITEYRKILKDEEKQKQLMIEELATANKENPVPRRSELDHSEEDITQFTTTDLIANEEVVIILSEDDFIKRLPKETFRKQRRGGRGIRGGGKKDIIKRVLAAKTHNSLFLFSNRGKVFTIPVHKIPDANRERRGKSLKALINLSTNEKISVLYTHAQFHKDASLVMVTCAGIIKKIEFSLFETARKKGIIAMSLKNGDTLIDVRIINGNQDLIICTRNGYALRLKSDSLRNLGRTANGVIGVKLGKDDRVIAMDVVRDSTALFVISELGYGKRIAYNSFGVKGRGGRGVTYIKITPRNGNPMRIASVQNNEDLVFITDHGIALRMIAKDIPIIGRTAMGVRLVNLDQGHLISDFAVLSAETNAE